MTELPIRLRYNRVHLQLQWPATPTSRHFKERPLHPFASTASATLPKNYTAEVAFRESEGENCTNYQGAQEFNICKLWQSQEQFSGQQILTETNVILDSMNTCFPSPNAPSDATWRFYTTCTAESMSSQRECSADALTAKVWRHAKDRATNSTRASMRHIFEIISRKPYWMS